MAEDVTIEDEIERINEDATKRKADNPIPEDSFQKPGQLQFS